MPYRVLKHFTVAILAPADSSELLKKQVKPVVGHVALACASATVSAFFVVVPSRLTKVPSILDSLTQMEI